MTPGVTIVTGAAGFAGRHLLDRLAGRGPIVAWHRPASTRRTHVGEIRWDAVDLTDRAGVYDAVRRTSPTRIYHLAGAPNVAESWRNADTHLRVNALGTHHLLAAVRDAAPTCRVLVVSSAQVYAPAQTPLDEDAPLGPSNPYGLSKLAQEDLARRTAAADGLDVVIARPFNHVGPGQDPGFAVSSFARQIARIERGAAAPVLSVGNLEAERDISDVRDVVAAYEQVMNRAPSGRVFNVCSGRVVSIRSLLDRLLAQSTVPVKVEMDPGRLRPHDLPVLAGSAARISREIEWAPAFALETTLGDTLAWWRDQLPRSDAR